MENAKTFGHALSRLRKERGYSSAHMFFKSVGGSKNLGLSFMSYWDMERGKKLPKSWRLKAMLSALGIENTSPKAKELVRAYFMALSGSDELVQILSYSAPVAPKAELPALELSEMATHKAIAQRRVNFSMKQWRLLASSETLLFTHSFLINTSGWSTLQELAAATGFKPAEIKKAVKALAADGLVEVSGDKARSNFSDKVIAPPPMTPETLPLRKTIRDCREKWLGRSKSIKDKGLVLRMTEESLNTYLQHLEKAIDLASVFEDTGADRDSSAIYHVDARIFQILPRKS